MVTRGTKVGRDVIFPHDWLYITLRSQHGTKIKMTINFKQEMSSKRKNNDGSIGPNNANISSLVNKTLFGDENAKPDENDEFNFKFFNLGNGSINDKKERLEKYLHSLATDEKNRKTCWDVIRKSK